ncbi:aldolase/citrate lyase family protein, partial [Rhizobiaceae bacterium]|nr:aldolase/citrate lyase family protein [Rhizobiaceae bacterium]
MMRSALFVPADSERKLEKGCSSGADALFLDLEDSVALDRKPLARETLAAFLAAAPTNAPPLHVRINAFDTGLAEADLDAVMRFRPVGIVLPKSASGADVTRLDAMLRVHEARSGAPDGSTAITAIVTETAAATLAAGTYANSSPRLRAMTWGAEDLAADLGVTRQRDGRSR